jgi:hypothetical protein
MTHRLAPLAVLLLSACAGGQPAGPPMTHGTVPRDARGNAVLEAVPPPPPETAPAPVPPAPIATPAPGAKVR